MCENEQKLEPWKKRAPEPEPCSWKDELRKQSCVIFIKALQPYLPTYKTCYLSLHALLKLTNEMHIV